MNNLENSKKINVLFLSAWYPNKYDPMPGLFVKNHAVAVSELSNVSVIYIHADPNLKNKKFEIISNTIEGINEILVYYKCSSNSNIFSLLLKFWRYFKAFKLGYQILQNMRQEPHLVHVNILTRTGFLAWYLNAKYHIPYIITEHWSRYLPERNEYKGWLRKYFTKKLIKHSSAVSTVTRNLENAMISCGLKHDSYYITPNVVDTSRFIPRKVTHEGKKIITHISCFDEAAKNIKAIVRLAKKLSEIRNDFELHLIGDGQDWQLIHKYADELGVLNSYIFFKGLLEGNSLVEQINRSTFTLLFSNYENFPVVIPESLSCGVPVLSSDVGGISEYLTPDLGILVAKGDENVLLEKANYMLDHSMQFNSEHLRECALKNFSYSKVAENFFSIYTKVLNHTNT